MDWSLLACGRYGHVTYAPDEPSPREQLSTQTSSGPAWRCLRCGTFVVGEPGGRGPAGEAPEVRRGKEVRSSFILRIFAVERFLRALLFGAAAYVVWRFEFRRVSIEQAFDRELPVVRTLFRQLGFDIDHSKLIGLIKHALTLSSGSISLLAGLLAAYAVIEVVEGTGLWLGKRWGEYFAMIVTSVFLPYEIYDLTAKVTVTRVLLFAINLALVLYLVIAKHLFGVRGGKRAYEARLRSESIMQSAITRAAATGTGSGWQADAAAAGTGSGGPAANSPASPEPAAAHPAAPDPAAALAIAPEPTGTPVRAVPPSGATAADPARQRAQAGDSEAQST